MNNQPSPQPAKRFTVPTVTTDPMHWLIEAQQAASRQDDPMARFAILSTIDEQGYPRSRTITLRHIDAVELHFAVNVNSPKTNQLLNVKKYELIFVWPTLVEQYRLRGGFKLEQNQQTRQGWQQKPVASQLNDFIYEFELNQSSTIASREILHQALQTVKHRDPNDLAVIPANAVSLILTPNYVEAWKNDPVDRLHQRYCFQRQQQSWQHELLVP